VCDKGQNFVGPIFCPGFGLKFCPGIESDMGTHNDGHFEIASGNRIDSRFRFGAARLLLENVCSYSANAPDVRKIRQSCSQRVGMWRNASLSCILVLVGVGCIVVLENTHITQVLDAIGRNEEGASEKLLPLVYAELRRLAAARMAHEMAGQTLQPTALVHEAWLRLVGDGDRTWQNRGHFFAAAAEAMRRILIERARHRSRLKHGGGKARLNIEDLELADTTPDDKILLVDEALEHLKIEDPQLEHIAVLKFFGGLSNEEIAKTLGLSNRTLDREWAYAKTWLFRFIQEQT
jgi:RNA polymerase sigma factor (TIGR02999 family)